MCSCPPPGGSCRQFSLGVWLWPTYIQRILPYTVYLSILSGLEVPMNTHNPLHPTEKHHTAHPYNGPPDTPFLHPTLPPDIVFGRSKFWVTGRGCIPLHTLLSKIPALWGYSRIPLSPPMTNPMPHCCYVLRQVIRCFPLLPDANLEGLGRNTDNSIGHLDHRNLMGPRKTGGGSEAPFFWRTLAD